MLPIIFYSTYFGLLFLFIFRVEGRSRKDFIMAALWMKQAFITNMQICKPPLLNIGIGILVRIIWV